MDINKEDVKWLIAVATPIIWDLLKQRLNKKRSQNRRRKPKHKR